MKIVVLFVIVFGMIIRTQIGSIFTQVAIHGCKCWSLVHFPETILANTSGCIPKENVAILQPNLSLPVRLRQKAREKPTFSCLETTRTNG